MPVDVIKEQCRQQMEKAVAYFTDELKGVRTGRAAPGLIEHLKVPVASYGSSMDLRELASISAPEPTQLLVKPFDPTTVKDIEKAIQSSNLGITPNTEGQAIRLAIAPLSGERRQQLIQEIKRMAEDQKVAIRNTRRDANRQIDAEEKDHNISEDDAAGAKDDIQKLTKSFETQIDEKLAVKQTELETV
jgi:ribosome recycling factor